MRIFHKDFLRVLPKEYLLTQWDDLLKIVNAIEKGRTPQYNIKVLNYPAEQFKKYVSLVEKELKNKNIEYNESDIYNRIDLISNKFNNKHTTKKLFEEWHSNRYFNQNYYLLQEDYDCDLIDETNWNKITDRYYILYNANGDNY